MWPVFSLTGKTQGETTHQQLLVCMFVWYISHSGVVVFAAGAQELQDAHAGGWGAVGPGSLHHHHHP